MKKVLDSHFYKEFSRRKGTRRKLLVVATYLATTTLTLLIVGIVATVFVFAAISPFLPDPNKLTNRVQDLSTRITDRNGQVLYEVFSEKNRTLVKYEELDQDLIIATLATEDATFYEHNGFYLAGILRAVVNRVRGQGLQGGSTITQQVVKNTLLSQERTLSRKIKEFVLSLQIENRFSKEEILQLYLNESPYGGQNYGVFSASDAYFGLKPSDLTLAQAAYLAGLPQSPTYYSPFSSDPEAGVRRQKTVLKLMREKGWVGKDGVRRTITEEEYQKAVEEPLEFRKVSHDIQAPHFVFYVRDLLAKKYGQDVVESGGLQVVTSLDVEKQKAAEKIVKEEVEKSANLGVGNAALVAMDPKTGQILAMVGSKDFFGDPEPKDCTPGTTGKGSCVFEPSPNVTIAERQPGSSIKPITYAAMLMKGYTAAYTLLDVPTEFPGGDGKVYKPVNYDGSFRGAVSLRRSLANSLNIPAVKALGIIGIPSMLDLAHNLGITTLTDPSRYGLSLTLGGGETRVLDMTTVFATFANKGVHKDPVAILEVKDAKGNILEKWRDTGGKRVIPEDVSYILSDILSDDPTRSEVFGAGSLLNIPGHQVAVKTGTTDNKHDNHTYGYTPSMVVGVWVGNNNNTPMNPALASGVTGAAPIWNKVMKEYLKDVKKEPFDKPSNIIDFEVDKLTGMLPFGDDKPTRKEKFIKGTEPTTKSPWYLRLEICKPDGRIANDACREDDKTKTKTYIKFIAEKDEWQPFVDKWVEEKYKDDDQYDPPTKKSKYPEGKD